MIGSPLRLGSLIAIKAGTHDGLITTTGYVACRCCGMSASTPDFAFLVGVSSDQVRRFLRGQAIATAAKARIVGGLAGVHESIETLARIP